jgi:hypothetical protein
LSSRFVFKICLQDLSSRFVFKICQIIFQNCPSVSPVSIFQQVPPTLPTEIQYFFFVLFFLGGGIGKNTNRANRANRA